MLSIIICTYKRPLLLQKCLADAITVLDKINSEIIVINDYKNEKVFIPNHPKIYLYNNTGNGLASARNCGAKKATGNYLLFVDDDINFNFENVNSILELSKKFPNACFNPNWKYPTEMLEHMKTKQFGRFLINVGLIDYKGWVKELSWDNSLFEVNKLAGFFFYISKSDFNLVAGFNEGFTNQGTEDDELCYRLKQHNIKMYLDPNNIVLHNEIDRIELHQRLLRLYNGALNRRKAFDMGHLNYEIIYSKNKQTILPILNRLFPLLYTLCKIIPNIKCLDFIYFKITHILIAIVIYKGFHNIPLKISSK